MARISCRSAAAPVALDNHLCAFNPFCFTGHRSPLRQDGRTALVLEFMEGGTLHAFLGVGMTPSMGGSVLQATSVTASSKKSAGGDGETAESNGKRSRDIGLMLRLAIEIASGLAFLHEAGLVHRDVKVPWRVTRSISTTVTVIDTIRTASATPTNPVVWIQTTSRCPLYLAARVRPPALPF
jgi:serine/threonine protein kinase